MMPLPARISRSIPKPHREPRPGMSRGHREYIRKLPCCVYFTAPPSDGHHLLGSGERGMGKRSSDRWLIPLSHKAHNELHAAGSKNEEAWLAHNGVDGRALTAALWRVSGDVDAGLRLIYRARHDGRVVG